MALALNERQRAHRKRTLGIKSRWAVDVAPVVGKKAKEPSHLPRRDGFMVQGFRRRRSASGTVMCAAERELLAQRLDLRAQFFAALRGE